MNSVDSFDKLADNLSFEDAFDELEDIVARLESGEATLEESVALFERGRRLSEYCQALLDRAELRINVLTENGDEN
ncbi:MAG: exodeoxyribonuclease VII small subunit [bacterium]|nr:exodeoxyribonuclease VII small subunit [bacterium]